MSAAIADAAAAPDTEITLARGTFRLKAAPLGASLRGFWHEGPDGDRDEIVTVYTGAAAKVGGQGDVLIPFPGRVAGGVYTFGGETYRLEKTDKEGPNAIHGFLRHVVWDVAARSETEVTFTTSLAADAHPGYPFALTASVRYALTATGMTCHFAVTNAGDRDAPVAAGFHPYFTVGSEKVDTDVLHVPMAAVLEFRDMIPTGRVLPVDGTPLDFRAPRPIAETPLNNCYLAPARDPDGLLRIRLESAKRRSLTVWMDGTFDYVVLYTGDPMPEPHRRRALAIEPMTCGSDAFNHHEWGLVALAPGAVLAGSWGVTPG